MESAEGFVSVLQGWTPIVNTFLMLLLLVTTAIVLWRGRLWTAPAQDARISEIATVANRADAHAHSASNSNARLRRDVERHETEVMNEIRHLGSRIELVVSDMETITELDTRTIKLEQYYHSVGATVATLMDEIKQLNVSLANLSLAERDVAQRVSGLACSEEEWHSRGCPYAGACPLVSASPSADSPGGETAGE